MARLGIGLGFGSTGGAVAAPAAPSISGVASGSTVTIAVLGDDDATHTLLYRASSGDNWESLSRFGDGDIEIADLDGGTYYFIAYSSLAGANSVPSNLEILTVVPTLSEEVSNMLADGIEHLGGQRKRYMSSVVTYRRGGVSVNVLASLGKTEYAAAEDGSFTVGSHVTDFIVAASDLVLSGRAVEPDLGDKILYNGRTYTVLHLPPDGCWRWSDPYGKTMRIHTKIG